MKRFSWILAIFIATLWPAVSSQAQSTKGAVLFETHCATCHGNPNTSNALSRR